MSINAYPLSREQAEVHLRRVRKSLEDDPEAKADIVGRGGSYYVRVTDDTGTRLEGREISRVPRRRRLALKQPRVL